ncbi:DUF3892 domain-containing protein [Tepidicaulis sp. LMO-SS28]|uniref:DUF3892 domain-containing protein n=1 Tax=Tepidicaulis sp. LMO-SS28 TaxID=3447455 RepID=UPI003EE1F988
MATEHRVTCIVPDGNDKDRRIDSIGGSSGAENGGPWTLPLDRAIEGIENGTWDFYVLVNGSKVWVEVHSRNGRKYLKTEADGEEPNNLLSLPTCPA